MIAEIRRLLDEYHAWLRDNTTLRQTEDWVEITTPYLDRHNDLLQIYAKRENGVYLLTDDGYTIADLEMCGCKLDSPKRQQLLRYALNGFGVHEEGAALVVRASAENFGSRKHSLVQAMLAVNDLFALAEPLVVSLFMEDLAAWLDQREIRYAPSVTFKGKSGYDHVFNFLIPKSGKQPERLIRALNRPSKESAQTVAFAWIDTRETRPVRARAYAFLNDQERDSYEPVVEALKSYDVRPVLWRRRESVVEELAA